MAGAPGFVGVQRDIKKVNHSHVMASTYALKSLASSLSIRNNELMMKIAPFILMCFLLITPTHGQSIRSVNSSVNASSSSSASSYGRPVVNEQGGYNTSVQVIDQQKQFDRISFKPGMFKAWHELLIRAHVYHSVVQLKQDGHVNSDGSLNESVASLGMGLTPNRVIDDNQLMQYFKSKYPIQWVYDELTRVNVIGSGGFLVGTESFSKAFNDYDFEPYLEKINGISFGFRTSAINSELATELLQFLKESSMTIVVTQEETTRYQSRKSNFFDGFLDQLGGNVLGSIFYKDKVKTVKQKLNYSPNIDVLNLFSSIDYGFAKAPYFKGAMGDVIFYGQRTQNQAQVSYGNSKHYDAIHVGVSFLKQAGSATMNKSFIYTGWAFAVDQIKDNENNDLTLMGGRYMRGGTTPKSIYDLSFGLSAKTSSLRGDTQLWLGIGGKYTYHLIRYLGVFGLFDSNFGINLNNDNGALTRMQLGLQTTVSMVSISCGYEWQNGNDGDAFFEGLVTGIGIYF